MKHGVEQRYYDDGRIEAWMTEEKEKKTNESWSENDYDYYLDVFETKEGAAAFLKDTLIC